MNNPDIPAAPHLAALDDDLRKLAARHADELAPVAWPSEDERWSELVFCLFNAFTDDAVKSRELVEALEQLAVIDPKSLARARDKGSPTGTVVRFASGRTGLAEADIEGAVQLVANVATVVLDRYDGKVQRYLRGWAGAILDDMEALFGLAGLDGQLRRGMTHWLQNATNMPVSVDNSLVDEFCRQRGVTAHDLEAAADRIGYNVALIDDVIRLDAAHRLDEADRAE